MARARNIKPGFFRNADLVELPFHTRLIFIGLWTLSDREGRLEDRPKQIKMEVMPADNVDCNASLDELQSIGVIERYEVDGKRYIQIINFGKHQNPHRDEKPSTIPKKGAGTVAASSEHHASTVQAPCKHSADTVGIGLIPEFLIPDSLNSEFLIPDSGFPDVPPASACEDSPSGSQNSDPVQAIAESLPDEKSAGEVTRKTLIAKYGVTGQVADDFIRTRKAKRAPLTDTAMKRIVSEAEAAGISVGEALEVCTENGWQGFKADWYANLRRPKAGSHAKGVVETQDQRQQRHRDLAEGAAQILGFSTAKPVSGEVFDA